MEAEAKISCHACHKTLDLEPNAKIMKSEECPYCYADIRCCKMCEFHDPSAYNECRETQAERILEKDKSNFCDFFVLKGGKGRGNDKENALAAANALVKM